MLFHTFVYACHRFVKGRARVCMPEVIICPHAVGTRWELLNRQPNIKPTMFNIIIFGPPGSGKGTQSAKLVEKYELTHISTGDIFRSEIRSKTELGLRVQGIIEKGELVSDDLLLEILRSAMKKHSNTPGFLFDGYPRTLRQAADLDMLLEEWGAGVDVVLALEVDDAELMERLLNRARIEGRKDDTREVIANRLKVYHSQTRPLIAHYHEKGKLESANGKGSIDEIFDRLCALVEKRKQG